MGNELFWIEKLNCPEFWSPFKFNNDSDYYSALEKLYDSFVKKIQTLTDDNNIIDIVKVYERKILNSIELYHKGSINKANDNIMELIKDISDSDSDFAISKLYNCEAFLGIKSEELQFFRARVSESFIDYQAKEMLHIPFSEIHKTSNCRFSIPGIPSLYLANTSYGCWIELNRPSDHDFYVSPLVLDGNQKVLNLAVSIGNLTRLHNCDSKRVLVWFKLLVLMFATSFVYKGNEKNRNFKVEYIISQSVMLACLNLNYDGIVYNSTKVCNDKFSFAAINLALFAKQKEILNKNSSEVNNEYAEICDHIKIDDAYNYQLFKQISKNKDYDNYKLRVLNTGITTNIGSFNRQFNYSNTSFCDFDKFLFSTWKNKDSIDFGHITNNQV